MKGTNKLRWAVIVAGAVVVFTVGVFFALGVRSLVTGTASAQPAVPNPGHSWTEIELPAGTWTGLDADTLDGLNSNEIDDADDHVADADYATSAGNADTVDGQVASELLGVADIQGVATQYGQFWTLYPGGPFDLFLVETTANLSSAGRLDLMMSCSIGFNVTFGGRPYARVEVNGQTACQTPAIFAGSTESKVECSAKDVPLNAGSNVVRIYYTVPECPSGVVEGCHAAAGCTLFGIAHSP